MTKVAAQHDDRSQRSFDWDLSSEADTIKFGERLARLLQPGWVVYLNGPLGGGKTTLARGLLRGLGNGQPVPSPTFALVHTYTLNALTIHHFDLYRVVSLAELEVIGIRDYFDDQSVCLIEWPDRGAGLLPTADITIEIAPDTRTVASPGLASDGQRRATVWVDSTRATLVDALANGLAAAC